MPEYIAVIGSGGTALGIAAELTANGNHVIVADVPERGENLLAAKEQGGVLLRGNGLRGFYSPQEYSADPADAVKRADIVIISVIAPYHESIARTIAPGVHDGQVILIAPGSAGSLVFADEFQKANVTADVVIMEKQGNFFPNRLSAPGEVNRGRGLGHGVVTAFPANRTQEGIRRLRGVLDVEPGRNVLESTLSIGNVIIHVNSTLLNAAQIERYGEQFNLFRQGLTEGVFSGMEAAYAELVKVMSAAGWAIPKSPVPHMRAVAAYDQFPQHETFRSLGGPDRLDHRYISEDAAAGVALLVSLGRTLGVPTPYNEALLTVASLLNHFDYYENGRTLERFGLAGRSIEEIDRYLETGTR